MSESGEPRAPAVRSATRRGDGKLAAVARFGRITAIDGDEGGLTDRMLNELLHVLDVDRAELYEPAVSRITVRTPPIGDQPLSAARMTIDRDDQLSALCRHALGADRPVMIDDMAAYGARDLLFASGASVRIVVHGRPFAVVSVYSRKARRFDDDDAAFLQSMGQLLGHAVRLHDISDALREGAELHRATLGAISDAVFVTDENDLFTFICPNVGVIFGWSAEEVERMTSIDNLLGGDICDAQQLAARGELANLEHKIVDRDGRRHDLLITIKRVAIGSGTRLYSCRDITERRAAEDNARRLEREIAHAGRLATLGQMVGGIAHEISQPLAAIQQFSDSLTRMLERGEASQQQLVDGLTQIKRTASRGGKILDRLRALARKEPVVMKPVPIERCIRNMLALVDHEIRAADIRCSVEVQDNLPDIMADPVQVQQVILNLLRNAIDALRLVEADQRKLIVRTTRADGSVRMAVIDHGRGLPAGDTERLFEPFVSENEKGLGLGLAICRSIVTMHGGSIEAQRNSDRGATFIVTLPISGGG